MGFRDLDIRVEYRTKITSIPKKFIVPLLENSVSYKRAVGFFSSSALLEISKGVSALIKNGGRIQLIASPKLSEGDVNAIESGYKEREDVVREALMRELPDRSSMNVDEKDRFNLLAYLIANDYMDVKIAIVDDGTVGIYHEKLAIVEDKNGDKVVFTGSMNESETGMVANYGAIDVFKSWSDPEGRVPLKESAFNTIWEGNEVGISTYDFPEIKEVIRTKYLTEEPRYDLDKLSLPTDLLLVENSIFGKPRLPQDSEFNIRDYQECAVSSWVKNDYRGLFDMATGTGKTITALIALTKLFEDKSGDLAVIITCPYQHLVEQWVEDLNYFGITPIIAYSKSSQRNWKKVFQKAVFERKIGKPKAKFLCCITTNSTLNTKWMREQISKLKHNVLLIADEAHNLGAPEYQKLLVENFDYRLALSATFDRHHDEEGTAVLRRYFGTTCIEYPLEKAIHDKMLSEYRYYPIPVYLTDDEREQYQKLTRELNSWRCRTTTKSGKSKLNSFGERVAQQRARLVAAAANKLRALKEEIQPYKNSNHILVYCGAAKLLEVGSDATLTDEGDMRQITHVVKMLGMDLGMHVSKFTSEEDIDERELLKTEFRDGNLQALIAIKCLDEGVNIPNIRTAFMLASTTNPKEYIQRRGRLLRRAKGKEYAEIYDFITLPYSIDEASGQTIEELRRVYSLINNEMERGAEFARHAANFASAQSVLDTISESYRLDELKLLMEQNRQDD